MYPIPSEVAFGDDSLPLVLIAAVLGFFLAALETAKLNLEFTEVRASDDGYVTNLNLRIGGQAVANQPVLALVDAASFWVHRYFRETRVGRARPGDQAVITLMTFPDRPLRGVVDRIGWGIHQIDGSTGPDLPPTITPTFQWIRLAQSVPVRVNLEEMPKGVGLRVGTTAYQTLYRRAIGL